MSVSSVAGIDFLIFRAGRSSTAFSTALLVCKEMKDEGVSFVNAMVRSPEFTSV